MTNPWQKIRLGLYGVTGLVVSFGTEVLPAESLWTWAFISLAILAYIFSRTLVLFEPQTLQKLAQRPRMLPIQIGEATVVTLGLIIVLIVLAGFGLPIGLGVGVLISIGYLLYHGVVLTMLEIFLAKNKGEVTEKGRPWARAIINSSSLAMGEMILLAACAMTLGEYGDMRNGPFSASDALTVPLVGLGVILAGYIPVAQIRLSSGDKKEDIFEEIVLQAAILYVIAFTGSEPPF